MKKAIVAICLAASATAVWATCTSHTYFVNGKTVICTTCCYGSNCTTNCF
jgi:hypothetical protein